MNITITRLCNILRFFKVVNVKMIIIGNKLIFLFFNLTIDRGWF